MTTSIPVYYCSICGRTLIGSYTMNHDGLIVCSVCSAERAIINTDKPQMGWMCPRCRQVWSPYKSGCDCQPDIPTETTTDYIFPSPEETLKGNFKPDAE